MRTHLALLACVILAGCQEDGYSVRVRPEGSGFERAIELRPQIRIESAKPTEPSRMSKEEVGAIAALYEADPDSLAFSRLFDERVPADVQGDGFMASVSDPLGTLRCYVERPRGQRDITGSLRRMKSAQELVIRVALDDARTRFEDEPWLDRLLEVIDVDLRRELEAVGLELWVLEQSLRSTGHLEEAEWRELIQSEIAARIALRLVEDGVIEPADVLALGMVPGVERSVDGSAIARLASARLSDLVGENAAPEIWAAYERATEGDEIDLENDSRVLAWKAEHGGDPFLAALNAETVLANFDGVSLSLESGVEPIETNGTWDAEAGAIRWTFSVNVDPDVPVWTAPTAFAVWATPDTAGQSALLGDVRLEGEGLGSHLVWVASLAPEDREAWRGLLEEASALSAGDRTRRLNRGAVDHPALREGVNLVRPLLAPD